MRSEELKTGWLSPDGSFFECYSYDHICTARELVSQFRYPDIAGSKIISPDDNLMRHGWCYIGISSFFCHEWRVGWNKFLTESQKNFLKPYFEDNDLPVNEFATMRWKKEVYGIVD